MINFDIETIRVEIKELTYEDKLDFLEEIESDIYEPIEELQGYVSDTWMLKNEIRDDKNEKICKSILQSIKDADCPLVLDNNGNVSFSLGKVDITIFMSVVEPKVGFSLNAEEDQLSYQELIRSLLLDFKQDGYCFSRKVEEENVCVVDVVSKLMNNKQKFKELSEG